MADRRPPKLDRFGRKKKETTARGKKAASSEPGRKARPRTGTRKKTGLKPKRSLFGRLVTGFLTFAFMLIILAGVGVLMAYYHFSQDLPSTDSLKNYRPKTVTFFYADDGRIVGEYSHERRIVVPLAKIPKHVQQAFIAAEDAEFYNHQGVDFTSIIRAAIANLKARRVVQGASTITMQVARSFFLTREKSYNRKIKEAILAHRMYKNLSKDEVLFLYLNQIYLGHGAHGIESAAELYFGKSVDRLTIGEAALLAGLTQAPSAYSPFTKPKQARARQVYAIGQMKGKGFITPDQAKAALEEKWVFHDRPNVNTTVTPYFTEHVRRMMEEKYGAEKLYNDGLRVYTTVGIDMQAAARKAVAKGLSEFTKRRQYRGPIKQLTPEEVAGVLQNQEKELSREPLETGRTVEAVVTGLDTRKNKVKLRVGQLTGVIEKKAMFWALKRKVLSKLLSVNDLILVKAMDKDEKTGEWKFSLEQKPWFRQPFFPWI